MTRISMPKFINTATSSVVFDNWNMGSAAWKVSGLIRV